MQRLLGITVSLTGVALVVGFPDGVGQVRGLLLIVLGTLSWGIAQGMIRVTSKDEGSQLMCAMAAIAAPQMLLLSLLIETGQEQTLVTASAFDWIAVAVLALGGYVAAYTIWYDLLRRYRVDQVTPFVLLMPIIGVLVAFLFLHERPSFAALAGGAVILFGLGLVIGIPWKNRAEVA
ncbi:hypothetical protein GCM10007874_40530 [Labrys miyagiensis]|uniref:EamA domain-containing protein n=2 Tax=Labrys miyagiensis TaxID=346912 RepID=A0ABQ6CS70_9HYPH|nr:hypothetical protein GCM10007874_40530 [Labrys miyagiensis]